MRDYFAAKAMQSLIARGGVFDGTEVQAYKIADAMLKAANEHLMTILIVVIVSNIARNQTRTTTRSG
ncbi:hypothetical protein BHM08_05785 [Salmonella enterica]|nr:hypothetical protein [Salmonella enterica]EBQ4289099.1 hypothetical protein [Salmonella enterica]EBQ4500769.1 hypothetical protein [Salmonella enterica]ECC2506918.1 hypothetical protein [Salmonella enterica]